MLYEEKEDYSMFISRFVVAILALVVFMHSLVYAGSLDAPAGPTDAASAMFTLADIYNRLDTGSATAKRTGAFRESVTGPGTSTVRTLDEIMAKAPALDNTNGATAPDVTQGKTFWGLTSGAWGLGTGTAVTGASTALVAKTGQTTSFTTTVGEDGDLQKGVTWPNPRFTDNGNGTITDNLTGLIWLKNANCLDTVGGVNKSGGPLTWENALTWSNNLATGSCGLSDGSSTGGWRLPNIRELYSLVHSGVFSPAVPNAAGTGKWSEGDPFTDVKLSLYWSGTTRSSGTTSAWAVTMSFDGIVANGGYKGGAFFVWPIR